MAYNFETAHRRTGIGAEKWDLMEAASGPVPQDLVPFSVADMEFSTAPCIIQSLVQAADFGTYGYTVAHRRYQKAVCTWFQDRHQWIIHPEWLTQSYGVVAAILHALYAFTQPGDGVIYQPPVYGPFQRCIQRTGRVALANPLRQENGHYEMDFDALEALCARADTTMLLLCSPHNPVGRVWTRAELERTADICLRHKVLVFSDEIHCDFVYAPHIHTPWATLSPEAADNCVIGTSASKTFNLAGLSTANIIIPNRELRARFGGVASIHSGQFINYFGVAATTAAYEEGSSWLEELKVVLQNNYTYCKAFLAKKFPSVTVYPLEGTYLLWADFRSLGLETKVLEEFMIQQAGLSFSEGYHFGQEGAGFERINLACPRHFLARAMERLDQAAQAANLPR